MGMEAFPEARRLLITADGGGREKWGPGKVPGVSPKERKNESYLSPRHRPSARSSSCFGLDSAESARERIQLGAEFSPIGE
jgi:hypothetical protein